MEKRYFRSGFIVEWYRFVEDRKIARFLDVTDSSKNEPHRIVIKSTANIIVSFFSQWLVLVVTTSILKLCRCNVNDTFASTFRNLMNKTN